MSDSAQTENSFRHSIPVKSEGFTLFYAMARLPLRLTADFFFDLKFKGLNNVPRRGGAIIAGIHQSNLDPVMYALPIHRELHFLAKAELFRTRLFGAVIRGLHGFPVRRGEADMWAMKEAIRRIKSGCAMMVFPEGTRSESGAIKKLEPGIGLMARRTGAPLIPAVIHGTHDAWPKGAKLPRSRPVKILYGKPMEYSNLKPQEIMDKLDLAIRDLHKQILEWK